MSPHDPRHGQERGYFAHRAAGEKACDRCVRARMRAEKARLLIRAAGGTLTYDAYGCHRRLQALMALGWSMRELDRRAGRGPKWMRNVLAQPTVYSATHERVCELYEELCMTIPVARSRQEQAGITRAKNIARRNGWPPPLAWDDIDNDPAPVDATPRGNYAREELLDEYDRLLTDGEIPEIAARRLGVTLRTIERQQAKAAA
jgi:hypothetical protein